MPVPSDLVQRDWSNAKKASAIADEHRFEQSAIQVGAFQVDPRSSRYSEMRRKSMEAIFHNPLGVGPLLIIKPMTYRRCVACGDNFGALGMEVGRSLC